jgi:hypothetical protein
MDETSALINLTKDDDGMPQVKKEAKDEF